MDLQTKLSEESIFSEKKQSIQTINRLNGKGIYTIEDFINGDVEKMTSTHDTRKIYRAIQKILRYKYLDETLVTDVILEREYREHALKYQLLQDLLTLGLRGASQIPNIAKKYLDEHGSCKMIDILLIDDSVNWDTFNLREFYIDYYNNKKKTEFMKKVVVDGNEKNTNLVEQITELEKRKNELVSSLNQVTELEKLKKELLCLLNQKNELDTKISLLTEKINTLEGGKINNARK